MMLKSVEIKEKMRQLVVLLSSTAMTQAAIYLGMRVHGRDSLL